MYTVTAVQMPKTPQDLIEDDVVYSQEIVKKDDKIVSFFELHENNEKMYRLYVTGSPFRRHLT